MDLSLVSSSSENDSKIGQTVNRIKISFSPVKRTTNLIQLPGSKSESNRWLILQRALPGIKLENVANSVDTQVLKKALANGDEKVDVGHAGTAMRFLTAYFAAQEGEVRELYGSKRMHQRPIGDLVNALKQLGAQIDYLQNENYPPIKIRGRSLKGKNISIRADQSSQYISAILLINPFLADDIDIKFLTAPTSKTYIKHTASLLQELGFAFSFHSDHLSIKRPTSFNLPRTIQIESDWSAASYYFSWIALSKDQQLHLQFLRPDSFQADSALPDIYDRIGVFAEWVEEDRLYLKKADASAIRELKLELNDNPDIAQTIAVTCLGLGIDCHLTGLHTLTIKETNRLQAMKNELEKFDAQVNITNDSLKMGSPEKLPEKVQQISTYDDHRMAMAFAPLVLKTKLIINDPQVVEKSYPDFWRDLERLGVQLVDN